MVFTLVGGNINKQNSLLLFHEEIMLVKKVPFAMDSDVLTSKYSLKSMPL
jgi:hypothetical protein